MNDQPTKTNGVYATPMHPLSAEYLKMWLDKGLPILAAAMANKMRFLLIMHQEMSVAVLPAMIDPMTSTAAQRKRAAQVQILMSALQDEAAMQGRALKEARDRADLGAVMAHGEIGEAIEKLRLELRMREPLAKVYEEREKREAKP